MDVLFKNPGFKHSINNIMEFQSDEQSEWWRESLFVFYPQLNREKFDALLIPQRKDYLQDVLKTVYLGEKQVLADKVVKYNEHWKKHKAQIEEAFSEAFQWDCAKRFEDIIGNISLNPICPRYLETRSFDVFYLNTERGALGMALHELVHFVWFDVWNTHFQDQASEYETPHLKWIFSEMAVDPIMRKDGRLSKINPYFAGGCAYEYFYSMKIDGLPVLETLYQMYTRTNITAFMEQGYAYCLQHEAEIRAQMK